ncbi:MAG: hypothetical protein JWQ78_889 [Sediminibacterium sp.]|nr:hypothetical protein [Sediminibacterium sp.]
MSCKGIKIVFVFSKKIAESMILQKYKQVDDVVELCIERELEQQLKKIFDEEMKEGYRGELEDGRTHYIFRVSEEKAHLLQKLSGLRFDRKKNNVN